MHWIFLLPTSGIRHDSRGHLGWQSRPLQMCTNSSAFKPAIEQPSRIPRVTAPRLPPNTRTQASTHARTHPHSLSVFNVHPLTGGRRHSYWNLTRTHRPLLSRAATERPGRHVIEATQAQRLRRRASVRCSRVGIVSLPVPAGARHLAGVPAAQRPIIGGGAGAVL
jgi:hypothetical protein